MKGVLAGLAVAFWFVACVHAQPEPEWQIHMRSENEVLLLSQEIRQFRHEAGMDLEPSPGDILQSIKKPRNEIRAVCPNGHDAPKACHDVCNLSEDICDNMERICDLADQLGKSDDFAQQKCASAKASCRESKQRCCGCKKDNP